MNILHNKLTTLIILVGEFRGGEETWRTMYKNLMIPYNADLALCTGKKNVVNNFLTEKSKYIWTITDYEDWYDYFRETFGDFGFWESNLKYCLKNDIGMRVVIPMVYKHFIYKKYFNILNSYDRIILTRSDMYYIHRYPILSNDHFWIMNGEDHGGYCDRFFCFPSKYLKECLNICEYVNSEELFRILNKMYEQNNRLSFIQNGHPIVKGMFNSESYHRLYFEYTGIIYKIRRCPVLQFMVSSLKDTSMSPNWQEKAKRFKNDLYVRHLNEFIDAFRTAKLFKVPTHIE